MKEKEVQTFHQPQSSELFCVEHSSGKMNNLGVRTVNGTVLICQPQVRRVMPPPRSGCVLESHLKNRSEDLSRRTAGVVIAAKPNWSLYSRSWAHAAVVSVLFCYHEIFCPVAPSSHPTRSIPLLAPPASSLSS